MSDSNEAAGIGQSAGDCSRAAVCGLLRMNDVAVLDDGYRLCCSVDAPYLQGPTVAVDLNETAVEILRRCQQPRAVQGIVDEVVALYVGAPPEEIERSVRDFLDAALSKGWLRRSLAGR